jgi:hypothetical protein
MSDRCEDFVHFPEGPDEHSMQARDDRSSPARSARTPATGAADQLDFASLADCLPRLGPVLWLDRSERHRASSRAKIEAGRVTLLDHPALGALGDCVAATAHTQVTAQGPREWLGFRDADHEVQAKLYLLPDTDYLAWDQMIDACALAPSTPAQPAGWHAHTAFLRHALSRIGTRWQARLLTFEHRALPWLRMLGAKPPLRISLLGLELARTIARCEGAELVSPLHSFA